MSGRKGLFGSNPDTYPKGLLDAAAAQYPFVKQYNPVVSVSKREGDFAETWPVGEPGDSDWQRPANMPLDRVGVEVMRPQQFGPTDLAAEMLHVDPWANATRDMLGSSLAPPQQEALKRESGDYQQSLKMGMPQDKALANGIDSAMRGYTVGQWPASANQSMGYTPQQLQMLNHLQTYMRQGVYPSDYRLPPGAGR